MFSLAPTPVDWLLMVPVAATVAVWALYLAPSGAALLDWTQAPAGPPWRAWALQWLPLGVGLAALAGWLAANRWDWPNLGIQGGWSRNWRWGLGGAGIGMGLALVNLFIILVAAPAFLGEGGVDYRVLYEAPHARVSPWVMLLAVVPAVAVLVELLFRGFLLSRLLVWMPAGALGRWGAITGVGLLFAWDPFLVMSFREWHWLGWSDGVIWGYLFYRSGTLIAPILAHGAEVALLYSVFRWLVA